MNLLYMRANKLKLNKLKYIRKINKKIPEIRSGLIAIYVIMAIPNNSYFSAY